MADPAYKTDQAQALPSVEPETRIKSPVEEASETAGGAASPARDLQARLEAEVTGEESKMSARTVTAMVLTVCLATWLAGYLFYAAL